MLYSLTMLIYAAATGYTEYYFDAQTGKVCRWEKCSVEFMITHVSTVIWFIDGGGEAFLRRIVSWLVS